MSAMAKKSVIELSAHPSSYQEHLILSVVTQLIHRTFCTDNKRLWLAISFKNRYNIQNAIDHPIIPAQEKHMKLNHLFLSILIGTTSSVALVACGGSDSGSNNDTVTPVNTDNEPTAVLLFDEANDGDIINDPNNPQPLQLIVGENTVNAAVVAPDLDYITVNVPAGSSLTAINLVEYVSTSVQSFIAIQSGSVFTELASNPSVENLLGYMHFGDSMTGTNILPELGLGEGAQGFTPPLSDGDYSFWIQETGTEEVQFSLNFVVESTN